MRMTPMTRPHPIRTTLLAAALVAATASAQSQPTLTPPAQRITDSAIAADQQTYEALQARLRAINGAGRPLRDYHLAKAQCWLDVSFHEYTRNDRGAFPQDALAQADKLASGMEAGAALGRDTPLISGAERLRPDLWAQAQGLQAHRGWRCAQAKAACAEVELVHAGHEQVQIGWRQAKPYVQIAEDLLAEGQQLAERCDPPPPPPVVVAPVVVPPPLPPVPPPPPAPVELGATVVFNFDRHSAADVRAFSLQQLQALVATAKTRGLVARQLVLTGHADRLNGTGNAGYNRQLSEKRAATVRGLLQQLGLPGVDTAAMTLDAAGDSQPVQDCSGRHASQAALQECLLPNRRVDVRVIAVPTKR